MSIAQDALNTISQNIDSAVATVKEEVTGLKNTITDLTSQNASLTTEVSDLNTNITDLTTQNAALTADVADLTNQITVLNTDKANLCSSDDIISALGSKADDINNIIS